MKAQVNAARAKLVAQVAAPPAPAAGVPAGDGEVEPTRMVVDPVATPDPAAVEPPAPEAGTVQP